MHRALTSLCLLTLGWIGWQDPEGQEPPCQLEVSIDGVPHRLLAGQTVPIKLGDREVKVQARVLPVRR